MQEKYNVIIGLKGTELDDFEKNILSDKSPYGVILFTRNIQSKEQVKDLISEIKTCAGEDTKIFIDQEGGRVARIREPLFSRKLPAMELFENIYSKETEQALRANYLNAYLLGKELKEEFNIDGDFAPVCDIRFEYSNKAILSDRTFGTDPEVVYVQAKAMYDGLLNAGIIPCVKHIPGHGRASVDSHFELPTVTASLEELKETDFKVFEMFKNAGMAMTAHVVYECLDNKPATISKKAIDFIKNDLGFKGVLVTDDLSMKALSGSVASNAKESIAAGCDILLHCNGKESELLEVYEYASIISNELLEKLLAIENEISENMHEINVNQALAEYNAITSNYMIA